MTAYPVKISGVLVCPKCKRHMEYDSKKVDSTEVGCHCSQCRLWIKITAMTMAEQDELAYVKANM
jgi:hypothetical protein